MYNIERLEGRYVDVRFRAFLFHAAAEHVSLQNRIPLPMIPWWVMTTVVTHSRKVLMPSSVPCSSSPFTAPLVPPTFGARHHLTTSSRHSRDSTSLSPIRSRLLVDPTPTMLGASGLLACLHSDF
ncbi:hypothetical protein BC938DRAFT_479287 [Jimgerdemannia flammicorona]|uniref:Uncharacterized protein n=1 Tax=Jimgerdemannia flammicorona TaxID=994334 RepID=A0A433QL66_9FUNG|nr:hypothetical protein BC938DRAFT_479287 [Jimgerdemannia flammicorona]